MTVNFNEPIELEDDIDRQGYTVTYIKDVNNTFYPRLVAITSKEDGREIYTQYNDKGWPIAGTRLIRNLSVVKKFGYVALYLSDSGEVVAMGGHLKKNK